jgi:hypothetical protein
VKITRIGAAAISLTMAQIGTRNAVLPVAATTTPANDVVSLSLSSGNISMFTISGALQTLQTQKKRIA